MASAVRELPRLSDAQRALVERNLRLVPWFVGRKSSASLVWLFADSEDAQQAAALGLVKAAARWDESRGTAFSTYAFYVMRNEMVNQAAYQRGLRHPRCRTGKDGSLYTPVAQGVPPWTAAADRGEQELERQEWRRQRLWRLTRDGRLAAPDRWLLACRLMGWGWDRIGAARGTTRQAAHHAGKAAYRRIRDFVAGDESCT